MGKKGMKRTYRCSICGKHFAMEWAKDNCEKKCKEYELARKK